MDRPGLTKDAPIIAQDQLDPKCLHDKKHLNIGSGNKMEMISDSVSVKSDASRLEKDNMTQVRSVCFCFYAGTFLLVLIYNHIKC